MSNEYNSDAMVRLTGLEPIQKRPGMYTDTDKPNHLIQEVVDNSIDEAMGGYAKNIYISILNNGFIEVADDGRGIPVDINKEHGTSGVEMAFEEIHAGGKFTGDNYEFSGGLHGVGISVVNALSDRVDVEIKRNGKLYSLAYEKGLKVHPLKEIKGVKFPKSETGTKVSFKPTESYFDTLEINESHLFELLKGKSILCPGVKITFYREKKDKTDVLFYENGISEFMGSHPNSEEAFADIFFLGEGAKKDNGMNFEWGCYFAEASQLNLSYANLIPTISGGTHVAAFRTGLFEGVKEYANLHNLIPKNIQLLVGDVWQNVNSVISLKMRELQFKGQTKEKLSSKECVSFITSLVKDSFSLYLNENTERANVLLETFITNASKRQRTEKKIERKSLGKSMAMPGKLKDCAIANREDAELFIVEGDSAGGSAKQARDRLFQAILPLRGKIINSWELTSEKSMESKEVGDLATAIGVNPNSSDLSELRYGKICILADADSDGLHIATLFLALMLAHFRPLVEGGYIYISMPPLYRIDIGKKVFYALDEDEKNEILTRAKKDKLKGEPNVQRFKGLGEMNPEQLAETTLEPNTRRLVQVTMDDSDSTLEVFDMLLKKKNSDLRKKWLESNGNDFELDL